MRNYDIKHKVGDKVWIVNGQVVNEVKIKKIRVEEFEPYEIHENNERSKYGKENAKKGFSIKYLLPIREDTFAGVNSSVEYEWYYPQQVHNSSEEAIEYIWDKK